MRASTSLASPEHEAGEALAARAEAIAPWVRGAGTSYVHVSDDRGASWQKMGTGFSYPWYMGQIRVDPTNPDRVYFMGVPLQVSTDGGRTFRTTATASS